MRKIMRRLVMLLLLVGIISGIGLLNPQNAFAEESTQVTGSVTDQYRRPLSGVTVTLTAVNDASVLYGPVLTDATGGYSINISPGHYTFHFDMNNYYNSSTTVTGIVSGQNTVINSTIDVLYVFKGILKTNQGIPIPGANIRMYGSQGDIKTISTAADGSYEVSSSPQSYSFEIRINSPSPLNRMYSTQFTTLAENYNDFVKILNLEAADLYQDMSLTTHKLTVYVRDVYGNPIPNPYMGVSYFAEKEGFPGVMLRTGEGAGYRGDQAGKSEYYVYGNANFDLAPGNSQGGHNVCYVNDTIGVIVACHNRPMFVTEDTTLTIVTPPSAPSNVSVTTLTQAPQLQWSSSFGADFYNVYRNGVKVGTTVTTQFTDLNAGEGTVEYKVTAAHQNGESVMSTSVDSIVDKTLPVIKGTLSLQPNQNGWYNSDVTATFTCEDSVSGIQSCASPVTVGVEGANLAISGNALDRAGNTATTSLSINIDKTLPTISNLVMTPTRFSAAPGPKVVNLTANGVDSLSGVASGKCSIRNSAGILAAENIVMSISGQSLSSQYDVQALPKDRYTVSCQTIDRAANISPLLTFPESLVLAK